MMPWFTIDQMIHRRELHLTANLTDTLQTMEPMTFAGERRYPHEN